MGATTSAEGIQVIRTLATVIPRGEILPSGAALPSSNSQGFDRGDDLELLLSITFFQPRIATRPTKTPRSPRTRDFDFPILQDGCRSPRSGYTPVSQVGSTKQGDGQCSPVLPLTNSPLFGRQLTPKDAISLRTQTRNRFGWRFYRGVFSQSVKLFG
jgi:hypothetical protein